MDSVIQTYFQNLESKDKEIQYEAYKSILLATENEVDWTYDVWDQLKLDLAHPDNHRRSRSAQFLSSLAVSDPEKRILKDFLLLWEVTKDKKFVTARHSLQSVWKVGLAGSEQKEMVIHHLVERYHHCMAEKNYTLIRFDIIQALRNLYDVLKEEEIEQAALNLIAIEEDVKYQKKYGALWKQTS